MPNVGTNTSVGMEFVAFPTMEKLSRRSELVLQRILIQFCTLLVLLSSGVTIDHGHRPKWV
jgi:hypothetical protein